MSILSSIDIFGTTFQFTTFKKTKFKTIAGGLLTIASMITMIVFIFLFGQDFFYKENPTILTETGVKSNFSEPFLLTNENFMIAFRFSGRPPVNVVNYTGIFYPEFHHYSYIMNSTGQHLVKQTALEIKKCSEIQNKKSPFFQKGLNYETYECIDWDGKNLTFGGSMDAPFADYFVMSFNVCKGYTFASPNCTPFDVLNQAVSGNTGIIMEISYPNYHFSPQELVDPMKVDYIHTMYSLNMNLRKRDRIYFKEAKLLDDQGWILKDVKNTTLQVFSSLVPEYYIFNVADYGKPDVSSIFYTMIFYYTKDFDKIQRSFMKFQDLAAIVGGFSKIILMFGHVCAGLFYAYMRNNIIYSQLFEYEPLDHKKEIREMRNLNKIEGSNDGATTIKLPITNNFLKGDETHGNSDIRNLNTDLKLITKNRATKQAFELMAKNSLKDSYFDGKNLTGSNINILKPKPVNKKKLMHFGFTFALKYYLCCKRKTNNEDVKIYRFLKSYLNERLDVVYYLNTLEKIDRIRVVLFNYYQNLGFDFLKTPNIMNEKELNNLDLDLHRDYEKEYKEMLNYFEFKLKNKNLDDYDEQILKIINVDNKI